MKLSESSLVKILNHNFALRLLLAYGYRWVLIATLLVGIYFSLGVLKAVHTHTLDIFLRTPRMTVLLLAVIACVAGACWYPRQLLQVLTAVPRAFEVEPQEVNRLVEKWTSWIKLPITLSCGAALAIIAIVIFLHPHIVGIVRDPRWQVPLLQWLRPYTIGLFTICAIALGGAVEVFLATMYLLHKLFRFDLRLSHYRLLQPLSTFSTGLSSCALVAVALFILLMLGQVNSVVLLVAGIGTVGAILMFAVSQVSYLGAIGRAKSKYLNRIGVLYEQHYEIVNQNHPDTESLKRAKESIEALETVERNIKAIPVLLIDLSDVLRTVIYMLAPLGSILISALLQKLK